MNSLIVFFALFAVALAAPQQSTHVPILQHDHVADDRGQFHYQFLAGNGIFARESGKLVPNTEGDGYVLVKEGETRYTSPEGSPIRLTYKADANGFNAEGDAIPVQPTPQ